MTVVEIRRLNHQQPEGVWSVRPWLQRGSIAALRMLIQPGRGQEILRCAQNDRGGWKDTAARMTIRGSSMF